MTSHYDAIKFHPSKSVQDNFDCMNDQLNDIMKECFKLVSHKPNRPPECHGQIRKTQELLQQIAKEGKVQRSVASHYLKFLHEKVAEKVFQKKAARIADVAVKLTEEEKFSTNKFWQLKKSHSNKNGSKCSVISSNNVELFSDTAILQEYENEFVSRLSLRQISESLKDYEEKSNLLLNMMLEGSYDLHDEPDFTALELDRAIADLKNNTPGEDLIPAIVFKNSGPGLRKSYLKLINDIKNKRDDVPRQFDKVIITAIHKKGPLKLLENKRGIFLTIALSKIIEKMIKIRINPNLRKVNKLQSGNTENRSCADTTFLLRGVLDHSHYVNKPVYILTYDYAQCFDSLWLEDCLLSLWDLGVSTQLLNMMYKMNKMASVCVNTPHGRTNQFQVERIVKQGTVLGPGMCSSSTAEFADENVGGVAVGSLSIGSLLYVDDMNLLCMNDVDTEAAHARAMNFSKRKRLDYKQKKCYLMIANKKKQDAIPKLDIDGVPMSQINIIKVLGDLFNDKCNNKDLINDRVRRATICIVNSMSLCNELSLGIYAISTLLVIYRSVFLSSVLFNAQAWSNIKKTEYDKLQIVQLKYLKRSIKAPPSCPNAGTFLEFGVLPIANEIHIRQLNFLHHILTLHTSDPVFLMLTQLRKFSAEKNWANDIDALCQQYDICYSDEEIRSMSKHTWKKLVKHKVRAFAFNLLVNECSSMKKTKHLKYDTFSCQSYLVSMSPSDASVLFRARLRSINCRANMPGSHQDLVCRLCGEDVETQEHIVNCRHVKGDKECIDVNVVNDLEADSSTLRELCTRFRYFEELRIERG